jgi:hypothetical protein
MSEVSPWQRNSRPAAGIVRFDAGPREKVGLHGRSPKPRRAARPPHGAGSLDKLAPPDKINAGMAGHTIADQADFS